MFLGKEWEGRRRKEQEEKKGKLSSYLSVRVEWGPDWSLAPTQEHKVVSFQEDVRFNFPLHKASYLADCHFNQQQIEDRLCVTMVQSSPLL